MSGGDTLRLVRGPALIAFGVTLLRLVGERGHWSERWFSPATGGIVPQGMSWLFGITWLAIPFGAYFGLRLTRAGEGPLRPGRALAWSLVGLAVLLVAGRLAGRVPLPFPPILIAIWLVMVAAAALAWIGWPALGRTLLAYGLASRLPVVAVMFLAMRANWGTHYDYVGMPPQFQMAFWPRFLWLALFPQLVFWVGFTILMGALAGSLAVALLMRPRVA
jgi:hypothetical protein